MTKEILGHLFSEEIINEVEKPGPLRTLGDALLKTVFIEYLMQNKEYNQKDITIKKSMIENRKALGEIASLLGIKDGETLEGYIGAIYLHHGGFENVKNSITKNIIPELNRIDQEKHTNWIGLIKEILDKKNDYFADYKLCEGFSDRSPSFKFDLYVNGYLIESGDEASDKTSARQNVSKKAYEKILEL